MVREVRKKSGYRAALWTVLVAGGLCFARPARSEMKAGRALPENPLAGSALFIQKGCIECHSVLRFGGSFGPDLTPIGREMDFFQIAGALWSHSPKMIEVMEEKGIPRFILTPDETEKLITFIYYLGFFEPMGDYAKGSEVYSRKGCAQCHSLGGKRPISLDQYGRSASPAVIAAELWNHSSTISPSMSKLSFAPGEMSDLLAYIRGEAWNPEGLTLYLEPGNPRLGELTYREKKCVVCHGEGGQNLMDAPLRKGLTEIVGMMWNHSSRMWAEIRLKGLSVPRFSAKEMSDLITYLYFIPLYGGPSDVKAGERIFRDKGCATCHAPAGAAKTKGPDLTEVSKNTVFELVSAMWNHVPEMEKMVSESNMVWPRFSGNEMKDLTGYIKSLK